MSFADKMFEIQETLTKLGHTTTLSPGINFFIENPDAKMDFEQELQFCKETGIMKKFFDEIATSEAVVFLNYDKK
jgi:stalled ribosome rescue protein Dom34